MKGLSLGLFVAFGLGWLAVALADLALPLLGDSLPDIAGPAISVVLEWALTQTTMAMGLSAAAYLCAITGARGWAALGLGAILPLLALAVLQFDPRIQASAAETIGPLFNDLRAAQPQIRLGLFVGLALIGAARVLVAAGGLAWAAHAVSLGTIAAWAVMAAAPGPEAVLALTLPAALLTLHAALVLAGHDTPAAPYILTGLACLFVGAALMLGDASPRQDLRAGFVALVVLTALAHRWQPRLPGPVLWLHATLIGLALAYLAPGLQQLGDVRPATTFAEMGAVIVRAEALRTGVSLLLALAFLLGLLLLRRRRLRPRPAPIQG